MSARFLIVHEPRQRFVEGAHPADPSPFEWVVEERTVPVHRINDIRRAVGGYLDSEVSEDQLAQGVRTVIDTDNCDFYVQEAFLDVLAAVDAVRIGVEP